jgi:hypothetical protein
MVRRTWLVYGPPEEHQKLTNGPDFVDWTINRDASFGDFVLFYLRAPISGIAASGRVSTQQRREKWAEDWSPAMPFAAKIEVITAYDLPIGYREMKKDPVCWKWGLVRSQMQSATGPQLVPRNIVEHLIDKFGLELE